jgi:hypothetical protein
MIFCSTKRGRFVNLLSSTYVALQSVNHFMAIIVTLVTPKAGAKHELLFSKLRQVC